MNWKFTWFRDINFIRTPAFAEKWNEIFKKSITGNFFFSPAISLCCLENIRNIKPFFCLAELGDFQALYPLAIIRDGVLRRLAPLGFNNFDYMEPLFQQGLDSDDIKSFWRSLVEELKIHKCFWDVVELRGLRGNFIFSDNMWIKEDICPGIRLDRYSDINDFLRTRRKSLGNDIERQIKRLKKLGNIELYEYKTDDVFLRSAVEKYLCCQGKKWQLSCQRRRFAEGLILTSLKEGFGHFSELKIGGKPVSWHFGFSHMQNFCCYSLVIDDDFPNYSLGKIHLYYLLDSAFRNKCVYFDLMRGAEAYKNDWADCETELYSYYKTSDALNTRIRFFISGIIKKITHPNAERN